MKAKISLIPVLLLVCGVLFGQGGYKGSITAEIKAEDGTPLPGVITNVTADTFARSFVSDSSGVVRFVGLSPDRYTLEATLTGFTTLTRPNIIVDSGQNVRLEVVMIPSTQAEEMVVTVDTPLMDKTKTGTTTLMTEEELNSIPQSRDPWSVVMTVPGIQTDRINVGGSEAGQQSRFSSKGDDGGNTSWVMDGVEFVDPAARGGSQSYLDFSSFQQMNVTTGGADVGQRSGGAALNFVTKKGSNNHQGSIRLLYADQDFQSSPEAVYNNSGTRLKGNQIAETFEKSFEIGGPIIKDRLWYWGAFSQNSISQLTIDGQEDRTELRNFSLKIHGDITATARFNLFYTEGDKIKNGRDAGPSRPVNTTFHQQGPTPIYKFEFSQLIGQHTELSLLGAQVDSVFSLTPQGKEGDIGLDLDTGVWDNTTFLDLSTKRPVRQLELKGNTFLTSTSSDHELSYGFQYKEASVNSITTYGENNILLQHYGDQAASVVLFRPTNVNTDIDFMSASFQDTLSVGNWTFKAGLRWDRQEGRNTESSVPGNPIRPDLLPAFDYAGGSTPFTWDTIAPRFGATYTWGDDNQYLVRGSVSTFYDTLSSQYITVDNPTFLKYSYHYWNDTNGDLQFQEGELGDLAATDIDRPLNQIDPDLKAPKTNEAILGFELAITPEFTVGVTGTIRRRSDTIWSSLNLKEGERLVTAEDYDLVNASTIDPISGNSVDVSYYRMNSHGAAKLEDLSNIQTNRPDYSEDYKGIELTATKRLSNRWMLRANATFQDWTRNVGDKAIQDPNNFNNGSNEDGSAVGIQSFGAGNRANIYFGSSRWTFNVNGLYQLPWDLAISANVNGREGFAFPYGQTHLFFDASGQFNNINIKYDTFDAFRGDDIFMADFKLTKTFHLSGRTKVELAGELFNAFNENAVTGRNLRTGTSRTNEPVQIVSPRVGRFSATVHF